MSEMATETRAAQTKYRKDYQKSVFTIEHVELDFDLRENVTHVTSRLSICRQGHGDNMLVLQGHDMTLRSVALDGEILQAADYELTDKSLSLKNLPDRCEILIRNDIDPARNTALEGLYVSKGMYCTQCEAEGFRRITYFLDQPDVMARYRVRIEAEEAAYPVLLSNGNKVEEATLGNGRHYTLWDDPFPKPSYLFALVAGDLAHLEDEFTTKSGKDVTLRIFVAPEDLDKCPHAMDSLKKSFVWDEEIYGLEYDLSIFNIVAVSHFNMGAMENKSLNIFNTKCVLAKAETATDGDFAAVEAVVAHEYFHNWTGNRVTCRDWFQLSLKEGLTVFRDQEFSADMGSRAVKRIEDVRMLRQHQFAEDSGPMAHPIRPDSYIEINNFYTVTVYEKGAEVIRMIHNLLGPEDYRKGMDLYFKRHDGQAVTCDDFVAAMEDATGVDLAQFRLWYSQAGTPEVSAQGHYDREKKTYSLSFQQNIPDTPGQKHKKPMHIPMAVGLMDHKGQDMALQLAGENAPSDKKGTKILHLRAATEKFTFVNVEENPMPSLLRGFSAPVKLSAAMSHQDQLFQLSHDSDSFNRWEAGQDLASELIMALVDDINAGRELQMNEEYSGAIGKVLADENLDPAFVAEILNLPGEGILGQMRNPVDVDAIHTAREFMRGALATAHQERLKRLYEDNLTEGDYVYSPDAVGRRRLKNMALSLLMLLEKPACLDMARRQFDKANNMTDEIAALSSLAQSGFAEKDTALARFYDKWHQDDLVLDKWFTVQSLVARPETQDTVRALVAHEDFDIKTPNRVRSVVSAFCSMNPVCFHERSGRGYDFLCDILERLDPINPQISARLVQPLTRWKNYDAERQALMKQSLERILSFKALSENLYEMVSKSLK